MTVAQMQGIADRTLRKIALRYGSTTKRDFYVIGIVMTEMIGRATVPDAERAETPRSAAQKEN